MKPLRPSNLALLVCVFLTLAPAAFAGPEAEAELPLPPDPFEILGRSAWPTPPLVDAAILGAAAPAPFRSLLDSARMDPGAALERLRDPDDPVASLVGVESVAAALELRIAAPGDRRSGRDKLQAIRSGSPGSKLAPWLAFELARTDLLIGRYPEAAAGAFRARVEGKSQGYHERFLDAADLLRAEAQHLARRSDEAGSIYDRLVSSPSSALRAAADLRKLDARFDRGDPVDFEEALAVATAQGIDVRAWGPRAAEGALRSGDAAAAEARLAHFVQTSPPSLGTALAEIRRGDLLVRRGESEEARQAWAAVEKEHEGEPVGLLAGIRLAGLDLEAGDRGAAVERLDAASISSHLRVAAYANAVRGRGALERGDLDEAFRALGRASRVGAANPDPDRTRADLRRAVHAAVAASNEPGGCPALVLRLSVRRTHLAEIVSEPGPFLRLGACFEEIGLNETAYKIYRSIPRIYGPQVARDVALPLARAGLASGEIAATRTRALAYAVQPDAPAEWTRLLAEASLAGGEPGPAAEVLASLVRDDASAAADPRTLRLLAQTALDGDADAATWTLLEKRLGELPEALDADATEAGGDAALLVATALRRAGDYVRARALYRRANAQLPQGFRLAEAAYWLTRIDASTANPRELELAGHAGHAGVADVARLADHARSISALRGRLDATGTPSNLETSP